jgi:S1-C subfamily serine protease
MPARGASAPALGDPVWAVGFPFGGAMTLAGGIVSQVAAATSDAPSRLMIDAPVGYGTSGGGVYTETGALIGMVAGFTTARVSSRDTAAAWFIDVPVPGQTLVTPLADLSRFLARHGRGDLLSVRGRAG